MRRLARRLRDAVLAAVGRRRYDRNELALRESIVAEGGSLRSRRPGPTWRPWANRAVRNQAEVEAACAALKLAGLLPHQDRPKNVDGLVALGAILAGVPRRQRVLEMGAAQYSPLLRWLYQLGYRDLFGVDLVYTKTSHRGPIQLAPMDLTATTFASGSFGAIACLSVIEHGVDVEAYLRETARLLRPGGLLVTSTDYWPTGLETGGLEAYGQPIHIFDRPEIERFVETAARFGLTPTGPIDLDAEDRVVHWERTGLDYTFVTLVLEKRPRGPLEGIAAALARIGT